MNPAETLNAIAEKLRAAGLPTYSVAYLQGTGQYGVLQNGHYAPLPAGTIPSIEAPTGDGGAISPAVSGFALAIAAGLAVTLLGRRL